MTIFIKDKPLVLPSPELTQKDSYHMPLTAVHASYVLLKTSPIAKRTSKDYDFWGNPWSYLGTRGSARGAYVVNSSLEQVLIDVTGEAGVLTHVLSPSANSTPGANPFIFLIEIDGVEHVYTKVVKSGFQRAMLGAFKPNVNIQDTLGPYRADFGSYNDAGFQNNTPFLMLSPLQAVIAGIGIPFKSSLKVTVISPSFYNAQYYRSAGIRYISLNQG